jgi:hypothetical protein
MLENEGISLAKEAAPKALRSPRLGRGFPTAKTVDGRSAIATRYRDILAQLTSDIGSEVWVGSLAVMQMHSASRKAPPLNLNHLRGAACDTVFVLVLAKPASAGPTLNATRPTIREAANVMGICICTHGRE